MLPLLRESRFAFDLELLALARHIGYTRILEAPVRIEERIGSTISLKRAWRLFVDTLGLYVRLSIRHEYDAPIACRSAGSAPADAESQVGTTVMTLAPSPVLA